MLRENTGAGVRSIGRERYTLRHLKAACAYLARNKGHNPARSHTCSALGHDQGCDSCSTCHFCRQVPVRCWSAQLRACCRWQWQRALLVRGLHLGV